MLILLLRKFLGLSTAVFGRANHAGRKIKTKTDILQLWCSTLYYVKCYSNTDDLKTKQKRAFDEASSQLTCKTPLHENIRQRSSDKASRNCCRCGCCWCCISGKSNHCIYCSSKWPAHP